MDAPVLIPATVTTSVQRPDTVTTENVEAQPKTAITVFWKAREHDITVINLLRAQAGLPPMMPGTSA